MSSKVNSNFICLPQEGHFYLPGAFYLIDQIFTMIHISVLSVVFGSVTYLTNTDLYIHVTEILMVLGCLLVRDCKKKTYIRDLMRWLQKLNKYLQVKYW